MKYSKIPLAQTVVAICKAKGIKHIVISPGSRSAPLTIGFTHDSFFKCYSIVDERCAAFFALGIGQKMEHPVALVCTSGSALLNYYPAISEAYYSNIPLVVLSADRPKHLIEIGDGQTIKQQNVYGNHVHYSANLKLDIKDDLNLSNEEEIPIFKNLENKLERFLGLQKDIQDHNEEEIQTAINKALYVSGPVHVNIPFDEPLYETIPEPSVNVEIKSLKSFDYNVENYDVKDFVGYWQSAKRKMVLIGAQQPNILEQSIINELASDPSVVVFTETTSNVHHKAFFSRIDQIIAPLNEEEFKALQPDLLLTFGGMVVSKKIKAFLRKYKPKQHWHIDKYRAYDTYFCLDKHVKSSVNEFLGKVFEQTTHHIKSDYLSYWTQIKNRRLKLHPKYIESIDFSDFMAFSIILKSIPRQINLQIGNSSAIRYAQLFEAKPSVKTFCNRGTSGIDGSTSTAIGYAAVAKEQTVFITGDLSFFYDSNALWNNYIPKSFRIIVINNQGGGIFRILPGHKNTDNFDMYFETKHQLSSEHLCNMYNLEYLQARNVNSLNEALESFYSESKRPKLLEVFTPSELNDEILLNYFKAVV